MTEAKKPVDPAKPVDTIETIERTPRARIFILEGENGKNEEYEALLLKIEKEEVEYSSSSGNWHDGAYRVQVHYFEIKKTTKPREDTDFITSTKEETAEKDQQKKDEKKKKEDTDNLDEPSGEGKVEIREDVITFDSKMDESPKTKKGKKRSEKTEESTKEET